MENKRKSLEKIMKQVKTPSYMLDLDRVEDNIKKIQKSVSYPNLGIHYAMFCNDDKILLKFLNGLGLGILVLNENEIATGLSCGFSREKMHVTGGTFTREELEKLAGYGLDINLDSLNQLEMVGKARKISEVGIRIRPVYKDAKGAGEGILLDDKEKVKEIAKRYNLRIVGLQTYIGTNTLDEQRYIDSAHVMKNLISHFPEVRYLNVGGGFGIPYSSNDGSFDWSRFGIEISRIFQQIESNEDNRIQLKMEPGRSIVGDAGYFLTRVIESRGDDTLVVDAPYTNFPRPFVYHTNHRVRCIGKDGGDKQFKIRGCSINSKDCLSDPQFEGDKASLPKNIVEGDLLCFSDVGAYSPVMQMDFFHYEKAPTIVIKDGKIETL